MKPPWATAVVTAAILLATLTPASAVPKVGISGADIVVHVAMFGVWAAVATWSWPRSAGAVVVVGLGLALLTELLQLVVPGRAFAWTDLIADALGVFLGAATALLVIRRGQDKSANRA